MVRFLIILFIISISSVAYAEEGIFIFVSFSMPNESLKGWMKEGELIHAPLVVRGLVNNSFKETTNKIMTIAQDNHGGIQLDPVLFNAFNIKQVPAVVVAKDVQCVTTKTCAGTYDVVYGDVHLDYALEKIVNQKDELFSVAQSALKILHGYNHA